MAARALDAADGLLLTGGEDMDPAWYGAQPRRSRIRRAGSATCSSSPCSPPRGSAALPILGICRGIQLINVAMGGTLYQDLPSERPGPLDHNPAAARTRTESPGPDRCRAAEGRRARARSGSVNSFHHQAVRDLAPGLLATGWTEDGLIEAVETADGEPWLLAVQWHPEEMHAEAAAPEHGLVPRAGASDAARSQ